MKKKVFIGVISNLIIILTGLSIILLVLEDRKGPVITFGTNTIEYRKGEDLRKLLTDVKAYDEVDGDVTGSLVVESLQIFSDEEKANVVYAARDSSNNITKTSRVIKYINEEATNEDFNINADDEIKNNANYDRPDNERLQEESEVMSSAETEISENDTNNLTDLDEENNEEPLVSDGSPIIRLRTNRVTISAGGRFNPLNYVAEAIDDKDDAWRRIYIDGTYDVNRPGEYTLRYSIRDTDGNTSNVEELVLVVE